MLFPPAVSNRVGSCIVIHAWTSHSFKVLHAKCQLIPNFRYMINSRKYFYAHIRTISDKKRLIFTTFELMLKFGKAKYLNAIISVKINLGHIVRETGNFTTCRVELQKQWKIPTWEFEKFMFKSMHANYLKSVMISVVNYVYLMIFMFCN